MCSEVLQDALFAAIAAIGFSAISRLPLQAYLYTALIAAVGHSARFLMMHSALEMHLFTATLAASFIVGTLAVFLSPIARTPAEACLYPALLPMIPGVYAYKAFAGLALCVIGEGPEAFQHSFYLFGSNAVVCLAVLLAMVVGATVPIFLFKNVSFQATRPRL